MWAPQSPSDLVPNFPSWGTSDLIKEELSVDIAGVTHHILFTQPLVHQRTPSAHRCTGTN